jgi:hypothetical protein
MTQLINTTLLTHKHIHIYNIYLLVPRPPIPPDVTRGAAVVLLNTLAKGYSNVRPEVAELISRRLSEGPPLADVPLYGQCYLSLSPIDDDVGITRAIIYNILVML